MPVPDPAGEDATRPIEVELENVAALKQIFDSSSSGPLRHELEAALSSAGIEFKVDKFVEAGTGDNIADPAIRNILKMAFDKQPTGKKLLDQGLECGERIAQKIISGLKYLKESGQTALSAKPAAPASAGSAPAAPASDKPPADSQGAGEPTAPPEPPPVASSGAGWKDYPPEEPWRPVVMEGKLEYEPGECQSEYRIYAISPSVSPGWLALAGTRRGRLHAHHKAHREDAFRVEMGDGFTLFAVCDGAGNYKYSRIGSETSCRKLLKSLKEALTGARPELLTLEGELLAEKVRSLYAAGVREVCEFLVELAGKTESVPKDFRCTLLAAVLWQPDSAKERLFLCQVGDGFMASRPRENGEKCRRHGKPDSGEWSGEVGCFIPDPEAPDKAVASVEIVDADTVEAFALCSDGIEDPFYPVEKNAQAIFYQLYNGVKEKLPGFTAHKPADPILGSAEAESRLSDWLDFEKRGESDDRTIVVLYRTPVAPMPAPVVESNPVMQPAEPEHEIQPAQAPQVASTSLDQAGTTAEAPSTHNDAKPVPADITSIQPPADAAKSSSEDPDQPGAPSSLPPPIPGSSPTAAAPADSAGAGHEPE